MKSFLEFNIWIPLKYFFTTKFSKLPEGEILEIRPNKMSGYMTVVLGKRDEKGEIVKDYRKYVCIKQNPKHNDIEKHFNSIVKLIKKHPEYRLKF